MKKPVKWVLISVAAVILLLSILAGTYFLLMENEYAKFTLLDTDTRVDNVTALKDHIVDIFFLKNNDSYILFDAGESAQSVRKQMDQIGINPSQVAAVFLTHTDFDHRAAIDLFPNAPVYISAEEENMINGRMVRAFVISNSLSRPYTTVKNGDSVTVNGSAVRAIVVPGHTVGLTCYLVDGKYLFTGDAFALVGGKIEPFNEFFAMDAVRAKKSIGIITALKNVELIFTAHYGVGKNPKELFADWNSRNR